MPLSQHLLASTTVRRQMCVLFSHVQDAFLSRPSFVQAVVFSCMKRVTQVEMNVPEYAISSGRTDDQTSLRTAYCTRTIASNPEADSCCQLVLPIEIQ
jgi:hypothetical protein